MPISPLKPIELIQSEIHNRLTPRDQEDRLHSELRGEEYEFTIERDGEPAELALSIENIGIDHNDSVNLGLRLLNYERPTELCDWEEDIIYLYVNTFLRGRGSAAELGNPLMADISVAGFSPHDVRISLWVSTTFQSGIWDAVGRIALLVSLYHQDWFEQLQELDDEYREMYRDDPESVPIGVAMELADLMDNQNVIQAYGMAVDYINYKVEKEEEQGSILDSSGSERAGSAIRS